MSEILIATILGCLIANTLIAFSFLLLKRKSKNSIYKRV